MRRPTASLPRVAAAASLLLAVAARPAAATPPEGCIGLPSVPEGFVCITQFTPANAVPTVAPGPGQTYTIPEFCVFQCFGPTPVTVPDVVVTNGSGVVAVVTYNGSTYTVAVPPVGNVGDTIAQTQQQVQALVASVLGTAGEVVDQVGSATDDNRGTMQIEAAVNYACFGCGDSFGMLSGTYSATVDGVPRTGTVWADFSSHEGTGLDCMLAGTAEGTMDFSGWGSRSFTWTRTGPTIVVSTTTPEGYVATLHGTFHIVGPVGIPCGSQSATATVTASGLVTRP